MLEEACKKKGQKSRFPDLLLLFRHGWENGVLVVLVLSFDLFFQKMCFHLRKNCFRAGLYLALLFRT